MRNADLSKANWRKSSYSNPDGGECLETAITWRKSTHSNTTGGECLEVADHIPALVPVRDSKDPARGTLLLASSAWAAFTAALKNG